MLQLHSPIAKTAICPHCNADVRCCRNCKHYSKGSYHDCNEAVDENISDKERSNFCEWFSLQPDIQIINKKNTGNILLDESEKAKQLFNNLFGD
ncbi:MAG: hypothetical protein R3Y36_02220 [Spirochaetales bacterium]